VARGGSVSIAPPPGSVRVGPAAFGLPALTARRPAPRASLPLFSRRPARMAQFLLAWELGSGLGHVGQLSPLARELARRGHRVALCLLDLVGPRSVLRELGQPCLQAPVPLSGGAPVRDPMS